ncbi:hypothetical protein EW145_g2336 [Phellinidium pouzarii]|uniref:DNA-directed RNA polymerase III subunit RPC9 n=1 Tax=Phellinidium pouzarii TaxID=167371 RepID=A0A4S4LB85_9AGAM|nr:hypothetical protein EW145_g2336 [Phellinidium pouzarii]
MSMEVVSARSALLSNLEVLTLLRELEGEQLARQKTALRVKKEDEDRVAHGDVQSASQSQASHLLQENVCENLRTVEFEAIQYLSADYQPTKAQSPEAITQLVRGLSAFELTKAEKLQIVNLAPTEPVELYVPIICPPHPQIVEEIEDRLGENMAAVLDIVRASISTLPSELPPMGESAVLEHTLLEGSHGVHEDCPGWDDGGEGVEDEYDDTGAGAGIEGDLEMDDD